MAAAAAGPADWKPLFIAWVEEWQRVAVSRNNKLQHVYRKALTSLQKCDWPLRSSADATRLDVCWDAGCARLWWG
jgi:hypothetical protein